MAQKTTYEPTEIFHEIECTEDEHPFEIRFQDFSISIPNDFNPQALLKCLQVLKAL